MLPRSFRISRPPSLVLVARPIARSATVNFQCTVRPRNDRRETPRFTISVSKSFAKSAVARNTMRRRVSAVIERHLGEFSLGIDVFVRIASDIAGQSQKAVEKELFELFSDANILP